MEWRVFLTFILYLIFYIFLFRYTVLTYIITYSKKEKNCTILPYLINNITIINQILNNKNL